MNRPRTGPAEAPLDDATALAPQVRQRLFVVAAVGSFTSSLSTSIVGVVLPALHQAGIDVVLVNGELCGAATSLVE